MNSDDIFRLLVPASSDTPEDQASIELQGCRWVLSARTNLPSPEDTPDYVCVSYAWGPGKSTHPFDNLASMSDRTMAVIETAIRNQQPTALWIDAFCVPREEPTRATCLGKMGAIYAQASQVIVVLSEPSSALLEQIRETGEVDESALLTLESDDWVTRAWTYQEIVNSSKVRFVSEGASDAWADAIDVLSKAGYAIDRFKKAHGYNSFRMRALHPRLDGLEDLIVDWKISDYLERSAYQVMCGMHGRDSAQPEDLFYAMIGAISTSPAEGPTLPSVSPAEYFMQICEEKGDYSFIYSTASRSEEPGRHWRPKPADRFHAVFPWHCWGKGQSACVNPTHIQLNDMWLANPGSITSTAKSSVPDCFKTSDDGPLSDDLPASILQHLRLAGLQGCGDHLELETGYFFSYSPLPQGPDLFVAAATGIQTALGSPGLLLRRNSSEIHDFCGVGMFVGRVPKEGESLNVG